MGGLRISILTNDGSPLGPTSKTIWGDGRRIGLGGAEYAMITMSEEWTKAGHQVILYNDPWETGVSSFEQRSVASFNPNEPRDVLIVFRSPNIRSVPVNNCLKVWWSCDQLTVGDFRAFSGTVNKIVCISPIHAEYFKSVYGITNTTVIDIPVRIKDYDDSGISMTDKIPYRLIFNSVPARGLDNAWRQYGKLKKIIPELSITITSDYRLWGAGAGNEQFRMKWGIQDGVYYIGAVPRLRMIEEQMKAQINLYPCNYQELFCVACAENQYAGAYPVTSNAGALATTNMGTVIEANADDPSNDKLFVDAVVDLFSDPDRLYRYQWDTRLLAYERFSPENILKQWDEKIFK